MTNWDNPPNAASGGGFGAWNDGGDAPTSGSGPSINQPSEETNDHSGGGHACFNCGQEGHNKADCPNPRVFTGECRVCNKEGHMAKDCPEKPAQVCNNCEQEGHVTAECTNQRKLDRSNYPEVDIETAWTNIRKAIEEQDVDDIKVAVQQYCQACPAVTYPDLENAFRVHKLNLFLIAVEKPAMLSSFTNMDLQGNLNKKYTVSYRFSDKPARPREAQWWPKSPEENLERLKDAGEVTDRRMPKCGNCDKLGHISKNCPEEKIEKERVVIQCINCNEVGHRSRDCPEPRVDKFACKNCGQGGHKAVDCPEPRKAGSDVECHKCGEKGHFSRDCPQGGDGGDGGSRGCYNCGQEGHSARDCPEPRKVTCHNCEQDGHRANECPEPKNMSKVQCRNCDEYGHTGRECPKPRDYSRVQCSNCSEMGHTKVRCKQTPAPLDDGFSTGATDGFKDANNSESAADFNKVDTPNDSADAWESGAVTSSGGNAGWGGGGGGGTGW